MLIHFPISASQIGTSVIVCVHSQRSDKKCKTIWGTWLIFISPAYLDQPEPRTCVTWPQAANQRPGLRSRGRRLTNTGPDHSVQFPVTFIPLFLSPPHSRVGRWGHRRTFVGHTKRKIEFLFTLRAPLRKPPKKSFFWPKITKYYEVLRLKAKSVWRIVGHRAEF